MYRRLVWGIVLLIGMSGIAGSATITVNSDGVSGDYATIQEALDAAVSGVDEITVEAGTYSGVGNRDLDFGGKALTLRSADGAASCIIDCEFQGRGFIFENGEGEDSVLQGFTIINGYHPDYGGGIECYGASPWISDCIITNCSSYDGGAIDCYNASPIIVNCVLSGNHADNDGGAIECYSTGSDALIFGCTIENNSAGHSGGGIDCYNSSPYIVNCEITGNSAVSDGGGIECYEGTTSVITNCLITGNSAERYGGAVDCYNSSPVISYCTIEGNVANEEFGGTGGIYADALSSLTQITSCIIWNNGDDLFGCAATYSCIEDADIGEGNISEAPQFRTGDLGDYYLRQRSAGQQNDSGCVDTGSATLATPEFDPDSYTTRTDGMLDEGVPDMGYHYPDNGEPEEFTLTIGVVPDPNDPHGLLEVVPFIVGTHPTYRKYSEVLLRATPDINADGYKVQSWYGLQSEDIAVGGDDRIITMLEDRDVSVEFMTFPMYTLTVEVLDAGDGINGSVAAIGGGLTGDPAQTWQYFGDMVTVRATPDPGYQVRYWTGTYNDTLFTGSTFSFVIMDSDKTVVVEFVPGDMAHLDAKVIGGHGSVTPKRADVAVGTIVDLLAVPDPGYRVTQWTGTMYDFSTEPNNYVEMTWSKTVTVEFEVLLKYGVYAEVYTTDGLIHGRVDPNYVERYDGTTVDFVATPDPGYEVLRWYGTADDTSTAPDNSVVIDGADVFVFVEFREQGLPEGTITLNGDEFNPFATIQDAIDAAQDGDEVVVGRGTYTGFGNWDLDLMSSSGGGDPCSVPRTGLTVRSEFGPVDCIIDCNDPTGVPHRGFIFNGPETNAYVVRGFTIRNGEADQGGALYFGFDPGDDENEPATATPIVDDCILENNHATDGGGAVWFEGPGEDDAVAQDEEDAEYPTITNSIIRYNNSDGNGGGIYITNGASPRITNTVIEGNQAGTFATPPAFGGGAFSNAGSLPAFINCLFTLNVSTDIGGAIYVRDSDAIIRLCTIMYNEGLDYGDFDGFTPIGPKGGIAARDSDPEINHCIIGRSGYAMLGYGTWGDEFSWGDDLFDCEATYSCIENGDDGDNNISGDPLITTGPFGDFYLSQLRGGQPQDSPCVDAGQANVLGDLQDDYNLGSDMTTTILSQYDVANTDLGYHYPRFAGPSIKFNLTIYVIGNGYLSYSDFGMGAVFGDVYPGAPVTISLAPAEIVYLNAYADAGYRVYQWSGTDDDTTFANFNTVTMYGDQFVILEFEKSYIRTFNIPGNYSYTQLQRAIDDARDGDTIVLHSGTYSGYRYEVIGKDITITSAFPNDPDYVAATIFDFSSIRGSGVYIAGSGRDTGRSVLNGVTIINARTPQVTALGPGDDPGLRGIDGMGRFGSALIVEGNHIIANCVIRDCEVYGNHGSGGNNGNYEDPTVDGGDGGYGGSAGGAGLYIGSNGYGYGFSSSYIYGSFGFGYYVSSGSPLIKNCTITNCLAVAGNGANGGDGARAVRGGDAGIAGRVFGAGVFCDIGTSPTFVDCTITDNIARGGIGGDGGNSPANGGRPGWGAMSDEHSLLDLTSLYFTDYYLNTNDAGDSRQFTANGAGVYVGGAGYGYDYLSSWWWYPFDPFDPFDPWDPFALEYPLTHARFENCVIANNITQGGISGRGGESAGSFMPPYNHFQIPTFGSGVYCAEDSNSVFVDCSIYANEAQIHPDSGTFTDYFSANQYYGYGGGVCIQGGEDHHPISVFESCQIEENFAPVGGGMYWIDSQIDIADSNFIGNNAYVGGGLNFLNSRESSISGCLIQGNTAAFDTLVTGSGDPDQGTIYGAGGGIYGYTSDIVVSDTTITENISTFSGGGVYFGGIPEGLYPLTGEPELRNCLITSNEAAQDGGGVSVAWFAQVAINNCTIAHNVVTGAIGEGFGYGGGVSVGFNSGALIKDSIIWYNYGSLGAQLAVANSIEESEGQPELKLLYSTVGPFYDPNEFRELLLSYIEHAGPEDSEGAAPGLPIQGSVIVEAQTIYDQFDAGQETVKIIVTLVNSSNISKMTDWSSPASVANLHQAVSQLENAVLSTLSLSEFEESYRYENFAGFSGSISLSGLEKLASNPLVAGIEPERYGEPMMAQALDLANALYARQAYDGTGITVAIVDTGVDYTHPDLGGGGFPNDKVISGFDFAMSDDDPMPDNPHGTACAGIAAGDLNVFGDYIGGVAYGAKIAALKIMTDGGVMPFSAALAAWDWCATNKYIDPTNPILVVSNSWGIWFLPFDDSAVADALFPAMAAAADILTDAGITVMAASGNDGFAGQGISFPSALSKVISVGAVYDTTDMVTGYSNTADILDILAPADPIHTTDMVGAPGYDPGDYFAFFNGTSAATPFAAGCVASIQSAAFDKLGRYLTPEEVRSLLIATGTPVTDTKVLITKPRVNLGVAMAIANLTSIPIYVGDNSFLYGWDAINELWDIDETNNIMDTPDFVSGYYLDNDSNCIDAGSVPAEEVGLHVYTTQIDGSLDADQVDMGYHYSYGLQALQVGVAIVVNPDAPGITGYASIELPDGTVLEGTEIDTVAYEGQKVILRAFPEEGAFVAGWYDSIGRLVSMDYEIEIVVDEYSLFTLEFRTGSTIEVSGTGNVLRQAVYDAKNGDTLIVAPGNYSGNINVQGKKLTIISVNPDDPDVVAATIIDCGPGERAFIFDSEEDSDVVVSGFTITRTGFFSTYESGGAMYFGPGTSPIIKNVRVIGSYALFANGGAFYIGPESSPTFINVVIEDCWVSIGSGGGVYIGPLASPTFIDCTIINCSAFNGAGGGVYCEATGSPVFTNCVFSGNGAAVAGGAIFFSYECESLITDSTFLNNTVYGSGGDLYYGDGGAVYYGFDNVLEVDDCNFIDNSAQFGGAVFFNEDSTGTFENSRLLNNDAASDGGAIYLSRTFELELTDCAVVDNVALRGGGLFTIESTGSVISGCAFQGNMADRAIFAPTDPNGGGGPVAGQGGSISGYGGGIYVFAEDILLVDSAFSSNLAGNAGGGLYIAGSTDTLGPAVSPELFNCLITSNTAGRAGGGVACDWFVEPVISNCTIADNGTTNYGGGLYISYDSKVTVIDSIIWANFALDGSQIAIINDNEFDSSETSLDISYSDVGPVSDPNGLFIDPEAPLVVTPMVDSFGLTDVLLGEGIEIIGSPSYNGASVAAGTFTGGINAGIGIESGIILTNGSAKLAEPPNTSDFTSQINNYPGDVDLDALIGGFFFFNFTSDATVLEFDFETRGGDLFFNYVFASEEYNESANSIFSDVFAFFLDGVNIALVPGTNTAVSINSINGGNPYGFFANNPELYNNNDLSDGGPFFEIEYDGFTNVLTARAMNVGPGVHHIKLAIADVGFWSDDSAVFIEAGSFSDTPMFGLPVYVEDNCVLNGEVRFDFDPLAHRWDPNDFIIADDPRFVGEAWLYGGDDPLLFVDGYMLSHIDAGQPVDSNCVDFGHWSAEDAELDGYTTRTDLETDTDWVDLGYHYALFELAKYELIVEIDEGSADGPHGTVVITPAPDPVTGEIEAGTMVTVTAIPDDETVNGSPYRVREWIGVDDAPAWQETSTTLLMNADITIGVVFEVDVKRNLLVPTVYATIEEAVAAASQGDNIVLAPGVHYISDPYGINFEGRNLTIMSTDPDDPAIIAATVIDCQGTRFVAKRAFHFFNGEDNRSKLYGITIKNGYRFPVRGGDGVLFPTAPWPGTIPPNYQPDSDPPTVFRALYGEDASGDGYGGAILCENESSPTFENCVFYNNMVTGAQGGDGADGWPFENPPYNSADDAQPGGHAGDGRGNGYGGAVSCLQRSSPVIINCTFEDNRARGGMGGNGGDAGPLGEDGSGHENCGGDGGWAIGFGHGGAVYFDQGCLPIITGCTFINNNALDGRPGSGGAMTEGTEWRSDWIAHDGFNGITITYEQVWGGALYYATNCDADITDSLFVGNKAFESYQRFSYRIYTIEPIIAPSYVSTRGGAIFSDPGNTISLKGCDFVENLPGAVYAHSRCRVEVDNCTFIDNSNPGDEMLDDASSPYDAYGLYYGFGTFIFYSSFPFQATISSEVPAGALYVGPNPESRQVDITDSDFRGNYTYGDGGAVMCKADATVTNCSFGGNIATGYGGAFYGYEDQDPNETTIFLDFQNCSFVDNEAAYGGGLYLREFDATFNSCYFMTNEAENGGGLFLAGGTVTLDGGIMRGNRAASDYALGGAMACASTATTIENFVIEDNVVEGDEVYGGGIMFYGADTLMTQTVKNCLFTGNYSSYGGGAVGCNIFMEAVMDNCTFDDNDAGLFGGALFCDWSSHPKINNSIFTGNSRHAVYEEQIGGDSEVTFSLFNDNPDGDIYDAVTGASYTGAAAINTVNDNHDNIDGAPLFEVGPLGDHYLAIASPAVDKGSAPSVDLGLDLKTTRTDSAHDDDIVDLGYHYDDIAALQPFQLTVSVIAGEGSVTPTSGTYYSGQAVTITAIPGASYIVKTWGGGTLNDNSRETINVVIMDADKQVTVEFAQPRILVVGSEGQYTSIQRAIDDAEDGDIVMLQTGEYVPPYAFDLLSFWNKDVTLTSMNPDDEGTVANTLMSGYDFAFTNVGPGTIIEGLTIRMSRMYLYSSSPIIRNCNFIDSNWVGLDGIDGPSVDIDMDGTDGVSVLGGAIEMYDSSPEISNCRFENCSVTGGNGGRGDDGDDPGHPEGWDGGWAGRAYGGAVYAAWNSNPVFTDCVFDNCFARGGNGGNGGDADGPLLYYGGRGGSWAWAPTIENSTYWWWWDGWEWGDKIGDYGWFYWFGWVDYDDDWYLNYVYDQYDAYYDYWKYTGLGGAFYCEVNCSPVFTGCTFTNNNSYGGDSGVGGGPIVSGPSRPLDIETAGGALYIGAGCTSLLRDCLIRNNTADTSTVADDPNAFDGPDDYYVSFGGGVAVEDNASAKFVNCDIQYNNACEGGGIYWSNSDAAIEDCNFVANTAYHGGGMYSTNSTGEITGTFFTGNFASVVPEGAVAGIVDPNGGGGAPGATFAHSVFGRGGGYYSLSSLVNISDSVFKENRALASGGGIFFVGSDQDNEVVPTLKNSLIANNTAGRDGGGISVNWFAEPEITNCTISDNVVTGALGVGFGYGGGIYVSYNSGAYISDSIIWDNAGASGAQIAVGSGDQYGPRPSEVTVVYSDIGPPYDPNAFDALLLLGGKGQQEANGAGTTSTMGAATVLVDGQTIYDQFDAGEEMVKVIVSLRDYTDMRNATDWDSDASTALLRDAIADRQWMVLSTLTSAEFTVKYQYKNIAGFAGSVSLDGLIKLLENPLVKYVEPDREVFPMLAQSIPLANAMVARQAYDGRGISIAIVDTGIDYTHAALGGGGFPNAKVVGGYDFGMNDPDPMPDPLLLNNSHGTACAGIAAGDLGTVGDYIGGVAYGARLYALKMMDDAGGLSIAAAIASWDWCVTNKNNDPQNPIMVVSNSWGMPGLPFNNSAAADAFIPALTAAADTLNRAGITILAASGNDGFAGIGISHPAAMSNVISVGAVYDTTDMVTPYSNTANLLDILAPADPMYTTDIVGIDGYDPGDYFPYFNGTSSACPFAAGCVASIQVAALYKTDRYLTPGEIRSLLVSTGVPITDTKVAITKPRVNLGAAIANLSSQPIYVEEGCILSGWDPNSQEWDVDTFNIMDDPLLVGDYFLSDPSAGQLELSPCVDYLHNVAQNRLAVDFGLEPYTTRSDSKEFAEGVLDEEALDLGFHHRPFEITQHKLYYTAIIDPFELPGFDPVMIPDIPDGAMYDYATQVELSITPPPFGFHAVWNGTDDDFSNEPENVVTMDDDRMVTVSFESIGYILDAEVVVDANVLPNFVADITLDPPGGIYYPGTEVTMTVTEPPEGFLVRWTGADDGTIVGATNVVTMNSDKEVIAAYVQEGTEYYAVIVGISDYYDPFFPFIELPYASRDARELRARLAEGQDWDEENIYLLTDSQATKAAIQLVLQQLSERLDSDDVLVFYFSGYGFADVDIEPIDEIDGQDEYLVTYAYSTIRDDELGQMLAEFATDNYVVLIESDFSAGQIDGIYSSSIGTYKLSESVQLKFINSIASETGLSLSGDEDLEPSPQDLNRNDAGVVLTACAVDELAFYSADFRHGVFTYYLLRAIEGGADWFGDNSGYVSAEEAYDYLAPRVDAYISDMVDIGNLPPGTTQRPRIYDADDESDIDILDVDSPDREPMTWYVPGDADRIQEAIDNAKDGDVIVLTAGTYRSGAIIIDKSVTITSTNPDDPDVVAGTVLDISATNASFAVYFTPNAGPGAVLNGITITANGWALAAFSSTDGFDGGDIFSSGLIIGSGASPQINNCVISGFQIRAGRGGDGDEDDTNFFDGNGGNGGNAYGGGVYCLAESSPTFTNTIITDCHVFGGDGGDGAEVNEYNFGGGRGGWGGWARGGGIYVGDLAEPLFINCTISGCTATGGNGGNGGDGGEVDDFAYPPGYGGSWSDGFYYPWQLLGYEGDYTLYSAYGGGVYCSVESNSRFVDCTITGNSTQGGFSGLGGEIGDGGASRGMVSNGRIYPFEIYEIPSFGGGVYCAPDSSIEFEGGEISSNVAPKPGTVLVIDPALGYGGGIVLDDTVNATFSDCLISGNEASIGGGVYWYGNDLLVKDCNIMDNLAYNGGGIYGLRGDAVIEGGFVHGNFAGATQTDPEEVVGRGGGIHFASVTADIRDLRVFDNQANTSGGGLYIVGTEPQISTLKNCLFVNNMAGRDGGGVSSNWFAQPLLSNCTFVDNWATGYFGFVDPGTGLGSGTDPNLTPQSGGGTGEADFESLGGGLYCGYESRVVVIDSIFKGNFAQDGRQLAVGTGFEFDPRPGSLDVSYSNVQGGQGEPAVLVEEGSQLDWSNNILADPLFVVGPLGDFYLSQKAADQGEDSPCVDAGSAEASELGMDKYTTRSDDSFENFDTGKVDMGFHYPLKLTMAACRVCDLVFDGIVDIHDMAVLAGVWLSDQCAEPGWCDRADINTDADVNVFDLFIFASCWLVEDTLAPIPDPTEWDVEPRSLGAGSGTIEMSSKVTLDAWWGDVVDYYFECLTDPAHSSGWRQNYDPTDSATYVANPESYEDTGLVIDTDYTYRVRVRDGRNNMTAWSLEKSAIAGHELDPPEPNPAQWDIMPYAISGTALRMVAYQPIIPDDEVSPPLEYRFRYTDAGGVDPGVGDGYSSGWQQSHIFEPGTGGLAPLTPLANYYYRVSVRDKFGNETDESVVALGVPDPAVVDFNPPLPDPPLWEVLPQQFNYPVQGTNDYWHYMSVQAVADPEGNGEEYYFECLDGAPDSGWLNAVNLSLGPDGLPAAGPNEYWVRVGAANQNLRYRVQTRDQSPNQNTGGWSDVATVP